MLPVRRAFILSKGQRYRFPSAHPRRYRSDKGEEKPDWINDLSKQLDDASKKTKDTAIMYVGSLRDFFNILLTGMQKGLKKTEVDLRNLINQKGEEVGILSNKLVEKSKGEMEKKAKESYEELIVKLEKAKGETEKKTEELSEELKKTGVNLTKQINQKGEEFENLANKLVETAKGEMGKTRLAFITEPTRGRNHQR